MCVCRPRLSQEGCTQVHVNFFSLAQLSWFEFGLLNLLVSGPGKTPLTAQIKSLQATLANIFLGRTFSAGGQLPFPRERVEVKRLSCF
jgi:hypothetical protein